VKILIVDDHAVVREGVGQLLAPVEGVRLIESGSEENALEACTAEAPDIVILDIELGGRNGLELISRIAGKCAGARVIVFTMHADAGHAFRAIGAGAYGYVGKSSPAEELLRAIDCVARGKRYFDRDLAGGFALIPAFSGSPRGRLSEKEQDVFRLLAQGRTLDEIARELGIAYGTIANMSARIKNKFGVRRTADLIRLAVQSGN